MGEPEEAKKYYALAIKTFDSGRGIQNRRTSCMMDYATFLQSSGEDEQAYSIRTRALSLQQIQTSEPMVDDLPNSKDYQRVPYPTAILQ